MWSTSDVGSCTKMAASCINNVSFWDDTFIAFHWAIAFSRQSVAIWHRILYQTNCRTRRNQIRTKYRVLLFNNRVWLLFCVSFSEFGSKISAHRSSVSTATEYFEMMIETSMIDKDMKEVSHDIVGTTLRDLIDYCYLGTFYIHCDNVIITYWRIWISTNVGQHG